MKRLDLIAHNITSDSYTYTTMQVERNQEVGTIWLNSPSNLNAFTLELTRDLSHAIKSLNEDKSIKVLLLKSKLQKIFSVGADIKAFSNNDLSQYPLSLYNRKVAQSIITYHKPMIAIVQGIAFGGGFQVALLSDIILCSQKAKFGLPEITLGIIPAGGGTQTLPRIVGEKVAKKMIMTGLPIDAKEAHRLNIAHLIPKENFQEKVNEIVNAIASKSSQALIAANRAVKVAFETTLDQGLDHEASIFQSLFNKKGAKEGIKAFIQKRKPNFKGI